MKPRAETASYKGQVSHRHEANDLLDEAGSAVLVHRGVPRCIAMACPDGCGEQLTVNLDSRAGPAWRHYIDGERLSLFPSVWRDSGCGSHFIVWRSRIYWCDWHEELETPRHEVTPKVLAALTYDFTSFVTLADALELVPWEVLSACNRLTAQGLIERGHGQLQGDFRRK